MPCRDAHAVNPNSDIPAEEINQLAQTLANTVSHTIDLLQFCKSKSNAHLPFSNDDNKPRRMCLYCGSNWRPGCQTSTVETRHVVVWMMES